MKERRYHRSVCTEKRMFGWEEEGYENVLVIRYSDN